MWKKNGESQNLGRKNNNQWKTNKVDTPQQYFILGSLGQHWWGVGWLAKAGNYWLWDSPTVCCQVNLLHSPGWDMTSWSKRCDLKLIPSGYLCHSHGKSPFLIGKPSINGPFPMAMLKNQRVTVSMEKVASLVHISWDQIWWQGVPRLKYEEINICN